MILNENSSELMKGGDGDQTKDHSDDGDHTKDQLSLQ